MVPRFVNSDPNPQRYRASSRFQSKRSATGCSFTSGHGTDSPKLCLPTQRHQSPVHISAWLWCTGNDVVRISIGIEDAEDLIEDLDQELKAAHKK